MYVLLLQLLRLCNIRTSCARLHHAELIPPVLDPSPEALDPCMLDYYMYWMHMPLSFGFHGLSLSPSPPPPLSLILTPPPLSLIPSSSQRVSDESIIPGPGIAIKRRACSSSFGGVVACPPYACIGTHVHMMYLQNTAHH